MREGLLDRIRAVGHWRVNFRPLGSSPEPLRLAQCREAVEKSRVSIRGWDFPHISEGRADDRGGFVNAGDHVENWTEWYGFIEFWRMYRSTQFLSYSALREDTMPQEYGNPNWRVLDVISTIYTLTEFVEFAHRLGRSGFYAAGLQLSISLRNTTDRYLVAGRGRMPFFDARTTTANEVPIKKDVGSSVLLSDHRQLAVECCIDLFDHFGWTPNPTQIEADIDDFYQQRFR